MPKATVEYCQPNGSHSVAVYMSDGSVFTISNLGCGESAGDIWFAPDLYHYPEPCQSNGKLPTGPFQRF